MHQYLDSDGSGTSPTCVSPTIGAERLQSATAWLKANNIKGFLGEMGGGSNDACVSAVYGAICAMQESGVWIGQSSINNNDTTYIEYVLLPRFYMVGSRPLVGKQCKHPLRLAIQFDSLFHSTSHQLSRLPVHRSPGFSPKPSRRSCKDKFDWP
jgi:Cellulase (glycosyl hydrolase family 5)